jgi:hypothetical protein
MCSFGTDSPLDQDIKERLMAQVMSVLSVKPDDEAAYNSYHKAEANKRLHAKREADKASELQQQQQAMQAQKNKPRRPLTNNPNSNGTGHSTTNGKAIISESNLQADNALSSNLAARIADLTNSVESLESEDENNAEEEDLDAEVTPERLSVGELRLG